MSYNFQFYIRSESSATPSTFDNWNFFTFLDRCHLAGWLKKSWGREFLCEDENFKNRRSDQVEGKLRNLEIFIIINSRHNKRGDTRDGREEKCKVDKSTTKRRLQQQSFMLKGANSFAVISPFLLTTFLSLFSAYSRVRQKKSNLVKWNLKLFFLLPFVQLLRWVRDSSVLQGGKRRRRASKKNENNFTSAWKLLCTSVEVQFFSTFYVSRLLVRSQSRLWVNQTFVGSRSTHTITILNRSEIYCVFCC